ncbi:MAG: thermostable hemolysin [Proteobacteria bacterium]|nr:thermostable hemolysin [Pseudomonadota bacterium]
MSEETLVAASTKPHVVYSSKRLETAVIKVGHPLRRHAEALIEQVYAASFRVEITSHYPVLVGVVDEDGAVVAAAGCRRSSEQPLYLEHYLDDPVETALSVAEGFDVRRTQIAEIGNLATVGVGSSLLFPALARYLQNEGATHAVATATRRLRRAFAAFGFCAGELAIARQARLPSAGGDWGSYFEHEPVVVWGRVSAARSRAEFGVGV